MIVCLRVLHETMLCTRRKVTSFWIAHPINSLRGANFACVHGFCCTAALPYTCISGAKAAEAGGNSSPRMTAAAPALLACSSISIAAAPSPAAAAAGGTPGPRASTIKPFQGVVASLPEAAGLPYDEHYAYLCLLRRSVLYGPTLGLPTGPPGNIVGRSGMLSLTGSAAAGTLSSSNSVVFRM